MLCPCFKNSKPVKVNTPTKHIINTPTNNVIDENKLQPPLKCIVLDNLIYENRNNSLNNSLNHSINSNSSNISLKIAKRQAVLEVHMRRVKIRRLQKELYNERELVDELIAEIIV